MGVDIYSCSGIIASIDDMLSFITPKNTDQVLKICQDFYNKIEVEVCNTDEQYKHYAQQKLEFFKPLNNISKETLNGALCEVVKVEGEPAKYDIDTHVQYGEELQELWELILETHDKQMPSFTGVSAWGSARYNGYDVPLGVACFIFDDSDCFEKKLSTAGKNLKKVLGHCSVTEWTVYSC